MEALGVLMALCEGHPLPKGQQYGTLLAWTISWKKKPSQVASSLRYDDDQVTIVSTTRTFDQESLTKIHLKTSVE